MAAAATVLAVTIVMQELSIAVSFLFCFATEWILIISQRILRLSQIGISQISISQWILSNSHICIGQNSIRQIRIRTFSLLVQC
jgi:hypothetical protein